MPAERISIDNAKKDKLFYFVANVLVYRDDGRFASEISIAMKLI